MWRRREDGACIVSIRTVQGRGSTGGHTIVRDKSSKVI